jgi:hypothetical protein
MHVEDFAFLLVCELAVLDAGYLARLEAFAHRSWEQDRTSSCFRRNILVRFFVPILVLRLLVFEWDL